ncbi:unnamed protein product [Tuber aestivum]|uniref:Uncharacterized protein n=1 Tax=Tuber aestivum TaxID=59557 RepID=A0A292PMJ9_9PEZI|nr:unnamed protein product [Tuber aestivum]
MPPQDDGPMEQTQTPDNNLGTQSVTSIELGRDPVTTLEVSMGFRNSEISLTIVHGPPLDQPIMTTRTRSASFSESEYESAFVSLEENDSSRGGSEYESTFVSPEENNSSRGGSEYESTFVSLEENVSSRGGSEYESTFVSMEENVSSRGGSEHEPGTAPVAAVLSESGAGYWENGIRNQGEGKEDAFIPKCEDTSSESSEDYGKDHTMEALAITLIRRALGNTSDVGINEQKIPPTPPTPPSRLPVTTTMPTELPANSVQLSFFNPPEPSYGLIETEDGVTVELTNETKLKFFSVDSEEVEDALSGLPTIAPKIRSLIERAKEQLAEALDCAMWDLLSKKPDMLPEHQEMESKVKQRGILGGLDVQVNFTVTATCLGEKLAEMTHH